MLKILLRFLLAVASLPAMAHAQTGNDGLAQQSAEAMRSYLARNIREHDRFREPGIAITECILAMTAKWPRRHSMITKTWRVPIGKITHVDRQNSTGNQLILKTTGNVIEFVSLQSDGGKDVVWKSIMSIPIEKQFDAKQFDVLVKDAQLTCRN